MDRIWEKFLFAYKDGVKIPDFTDYVKTPATRGDKVDPSGEGTCWVFKIEGFELEPGCKYEFGFQRGMQANNGITLVLAEDKKGNAIGYIQQTDAGLTSAEKAKYKSERYDEYEFISSWYKNEDGEGYTVNRVPMRFSVQTYADLSKWEKAADKAQAFLDSVTDKDLKTGKYKRSNIEQLRILLKDLNRKAEEEVKLMMQSQADAEINSMVNDLEDMLEKAKVKSLNLPTLQNWKRRLRKPRNFMRKQVLM